MTETLAEEVERVITEQKERMHIDPLYVIDLLERILPSLDREQIVKRVMAELGWRGQRYAKAKTEMLKAAMVRARESSPLEGK